MDKELGRLNKMDQNLRETIFHTINSELEGLITIRNYMYKHPEIGGEEENASRILTESLHKHGFIVEKDFHGIPHAFRAIYKSEKKGPVIGYLCEFDAMPETGHSCGHNIIATASLGAAFGVQAILEKTGGTVIVYGTPGEECLCTKVQLTKEGAFDEIDVAMMIHPNPRTEASTTTLAIDSLQIEFYGLSSHAGASPEKGINALDAAVLCYNNIGYEKQYLKETNVYGIINEGGKKASAIPDYASLKYLLRAKNMKALKAVNEMVHRCAESAAKVTGCVVKITNNEPSNYNLVTNQTMSSVFNSFYKELGEKEIFYTESNGSSDIGDVSHKVPTIHPWLGLNCENYQLHSTQFAEMTVTEEGDRVLRMGSLAMALTACMILTSETLLSEIKSEFNKQRASIEALDI